jgi:hypothetical protein
VKIDDIGLVSGSMGSVAAKPYPSSLGGAEMIAAGESYYMVGANTGQAKATQFRGVGSRKILQHDGSPKFYTQQLFFDACGRPGDSGAIIVHEATNSVVGLNMAGEAHFAIANPLYQKGWRFKEMKKTIDGIALPSLTTV